MKNSLASLILVLFLKIVHQSVSTGKYEKVRDISFENKFSIFTVPWSYLCRSSYSNTEEIHVRDHTLGHREKVSSS